MCQELICFIGFSSALENLTLKTDNKISEILITITITITFGIMSLSNIGS